MNVTERGWEYATKGDYHRNLDPNWSYTPTYLRKRVRVREFMDSIDKNALVVDVGCGEGVIVEEFLRKGYNIVGIDANYESEIVRKGDARKLPFSDQSVGAALLLDVFEHIPYIDQPIVLSEIHRVLVPGGAFLAAIPNLAHFNSRFLMALKGRLDRTDNELDHVGERPLQENLRLLRANGFTVDSIVGVTFSAPFLYRRLICRKPARYRWLHDAIEPLASAFPGLALLDVIWCSKPGV